MDRPIIFSAPMVSALLEGRKTMTRRLAWRGVPPGRVCTGVVHSDISGRGRPPLAAASPWQRVRSGDRLWVREAFSYGDGCPPVYYRAASDGEPSGLGWRPSIHMPRWASRLTLTVTAVRLERLNEITEEDARAEGVERSDWEYLENGECCDTAVEAFGCLWDSFHGPGAWEANPHVAVISFTVAKRNIDDPAARDGE